jgi:hypothetical protein
LFRPYSAAVLAHRRRRAAWLCLFWLALAWSVRPEGLLGATAILGGGHATSLTLADGHLDLVLGHHPGDERAAHERDLSAGRHRPEEPHADHVVHLCHGDDPLAASRSACDPATFDAHASLAVGSGPGAPGRGVPQWHPPERAPLALRLRATIILLV